MSKYPQQSVDHGHPSEDSSGRFPEDQLLREYGFRIYSRPALSEAVWLDDRGKTVSHSTALARVKRKWKKVV